MKRFILFLFVLFAFGAKAQVGRYSLEYSVRVGYSWSNDFKNLDKILQDRSNPILSEDAKDFVNYPNYLVFRINRWGIMGGSYYGNMTTEPNSNGHYYSITQKSFAIGLMYDLIRTESFIFSPYFTLGNRSSEIYLDYELKKGVTPTSLHILGEEAMITFGGQAYYKLKSWKDNKWVLFLNGDISYNTFPENKRRFNNQLVKTEDINQYSINALIGLSIRYYF